MTARRFVLPVLVALLPAVPAAAQVGSPLAVPLDQALSLDAGYLALQAQRDAAAARGIAVRSPIAGSPLLGGSWRTDTRGPGTQRELEAEIAAPMWLPGQRTALGGTVNATVADIESQIAARRLDVAGLLREAWWDAVLAQREVRLARDRLATARDIARDAAIRLSRGDIPPADSLLAENETLAAALALSQAEAAVIATRAAYATLTGGLLPDLPIEAVAPRPPFHPSLFAAQAGLAAAEARARLVAATPRDNPELGAFGRSQQGTLGDQGVSLGVRMRFPLATDARNVPRRAEAEADITRATTLLAQRRRLVEAAILQAMANLRATDAAAQLARQRLAVANQQLDLATRAFRAGETGLFELYRVRQLQLEAAGADARAGVDAGRARSRLNQALGAVPGT